MKVKITEKNAVLKTAKKFFEEDIGIEIDESLLGETVEEWSGSYTESDTDPDAPSGYTVTLEGTFNYGNGYLEYKVNGGDVVSTEGASSPIVLEGVQSIVFSGGGGSYGFKVGTTPNGSEIGNFQLEEVTYNPTSNITLYISSYGGGSE